MVNFGRHLCQVVDIQVMYIVYTCTDCSWGGDGIAATHLEFLNGRFLPTENFNISGFSNFYRNKKMIGILIDRN